jgi:hypothetical protein
MLARRRCYCVPHGRLLARQSTTVTVAVWSKIGALQMPRRLQVPFRLGVEPTSLQNSVVALDMDPAGAALLVDYAELYGLLQMHAGSSLAGWM